MQLIFEGSKTRFVNRITTGDRLDKSIQNFIETTGFSTFMIVRSGHGFQITGGSLVGGQSEPPKKPKKKEVKDVAKKPKQKPVKRDKRTTKRVAKRK